MPALVIIDALLNNHGQPRWPSHDEVVEGAFHAFDMVVCNAVIAEMFCEST